MATTYTGKEQQKSTTTNQPDVASLIAGIQKELHDLRKDRDILLQIADKAQLSRYYSRHQGKLPAIVKLRSMELTDKDGTISEKVIIGWQTLSNKVWKERPNVWMEDQKIKLIFEDGSSQEVDYLKYVQTYKLSIEAKVLSKISDEQTGELIFKVQRTDNQKELSINRKFVN